MEVVGLGMEFTCGIGKAKDPFVASFGSGPQWDVGMIPHLTDLNLCLRQGSRTPKKRVGNASNVLFPVHTLLFLSSASFGPHFCLWLRLTG